MAPSHADVALSFSGDALGPFFEEHHRALAARLQKELLPAKKGLEHDALTAAREMGAHGPASLSLYPYLVPEKHGGAPVGKSDDDRYVDVRSLVLVREGLAQVSPMADSIFAVQGLGSWPVSAFGSAAQRSSLLSKVVRGESIGAFALTEPEAGTDVASLRTTARREGDGWVLDGEKHLISNVGIAHHYVVFANADPSAGKKGITAFLVDAHAAGIAAETMALSSPHPLGRLRFSGCRIADAARIGEIGQGFTIAMETLDAFRISVGAAANGMAARALGLAIAHVKSRNQFGAPLAEQQQVQAYLADMATELEASRLLVARAAYLRDRGTARVTTEAAMAKMFATEAAQRIIDRAVQLHGGIGVLLGSEVEALYRDIRPLRIYEGTTEIQRVVIARGLLKGGAK
jgi:acyl-CoA dehydrogenase